MLTLGALVACVALIGCGRNVHHNSAASQPQAPQTRSNAPTPAAASADNNGAAPASATSGALATGGGAAAQNSEPSAKRAESEPLAGVKPSSATARPAAAAMSRSRRQRPWSKAQRNAQFAQTAQDFARISQHAFGRQPRELRDEVTAAVGRARALKRRMGAAGVGRLTVRLRELTRAQQQGQRAAIALAAADVYRVLVDSEQVRGRQRHLHLLGYALLRYGADIRSAPTAWNDAARAADLARVQWSDLAPRVRDPALRHALTRAIQDMSHGAARERRHEAARSIDGARRHFAQLVNQERSRR